MAESSEQQRVLTEQKTQLTAELTAMSNSMDKVRTAAAVSIIYAVVQICAVTVDVIG